MLADRSAGQNAHKTLETEFLGSLWAGTTEIQRLVMEFKGEDPPLSWHLSEAEKQDIDLQFEASVRDWEAVRAWLEAPAAVYASA
jgi:hypothetical protein